MSAAQVELAAGERIDVPVALREAIERGILKAAVARQGGETVAIDAFTAALTAALHQAGFLLVPRGFSRLRELVDAGIYAQALEGKHAVERQLQAARLVVGELPELGCLLGHAEALVAVLTGHAPPADRPRLLASFDERLRKLREVLLGVSADEPSASIAAAPAAPAPATEGAAP